MAQSPYPFRLQVLRALTASLETITVANGYHFDMEGKVFRGRVWFGTDDPLPMLSIVEAPQQADITTTPDFSADASGQWQLLVKGEASDDKRHPTDPLHMLMADTKKCLAAEKSRQSGRPETGPTCNILGMNGAVAKMDIGSGIVRPAEQQIGPTAFFWLTVTLHLVEDLRDPFKDHGAIG